MTVQHKQTEWLRLWVIRGYRLQMNICGENSKIIVPKSNVSHGTTAHVTFPCSTTHFVENARSKSSLAQIPTNLPFAVQTFLCCTAKDFFFGI